MKPATMRYFDAIHALLEAIDLWKSGRGDWISAQITARAMKEHGFPILRATRMSLSLLWIITIERMTVIWYWVVLRCGPLANPSMNGRRRSQQMENKETKLNTGH
jgi:hypothetical protein